MNERTGSVPSGSPTDTDPDPGRKGARRRKLLIGGAVVVAVLVVAIAGAVYWYLDRDNPDEVSLEDAVESVEGSEDSAETTQSSVVATSELDGTWAVDTSVGQFSFSESTASFVGFRVDEELIFGAAEAVGRTPVVTGSMEIAGTEISNVTIGGDLSAIVSDESRREDAILDALEAGTHPTATFVLTEPIELDSIPAEGESISMTAVGDLTIHGVTQGVEVPLEAQRNGELIVVVGSLDITFADYGVETPSSPVVVSVEDHGVVEFQLFFAQA